MARARGYRKIIEADLDIMPLMNLFVVLIPMLLLSAVFVELSAIDMHSSGTESEAQDQGPRVDLALALSPQHYTVTGRGVTRRRIDRSDDDAQEQLRQVLGSIRTQHPSETGLRIESPPQTEYQELITAMDISRSVGLSAISLMGSADGGRDLGEAR